MVHRMPQIRSDQISWKKLTAWVTPACSFCMTKWKSKCRSSIQRSFSIFAFGLLVTYWQDSLFLSTRNLDQCLQMFEPMKCYAKMNSTELGLVLSASCPRSIHEYNNGMLDSYENCDKQFGCMFVAAKIVLQLQKTQKMLTDCFPVTSYVTLASVNSCLASELLVDFG